MARAQTVNSIVRALKFHNIVCDTDIPGIGTGTTSKTNRFVRISISFFVLFRIPTGLPEIGIRLNTQTGFF